VEATARTAADLDYEVIVVEDCCASMNQEMHDFSIKAILPNMAKVISSEEFLRILK
jgi:nicotinamidase-related amidase